MYTIEYQPQATKTLLKMPRTTARLIKGKIGSLAESPHALNNNVKRLTGEEGYRLRIGDWRVIYELQDERLVVIVVKIKPRGEAH
ncbi:MAG TPA: type II toxin-antitoxin system RelE/ParE family toxin [Geobacteraceae bacterium]|nr:type II toxin-antitoxin system RelE/ParE family toxin [Geobacteraceae bacterium]